EMLGVLVLPPVERPYERQRPQDVVIGDETLGPLSGRALHLGREDRRLYGADHALRDAVLQVEHLGKRAVIALRPDVSACGGVDELARDAYLVAGAPDAALEGVADPELAADLLDVDGPVLVDEAGIARDHEQPAHARQRGDDLLHHAIREIFP